MGAGNYLLSSEKGECVYLDLPGDNDDESNEIDFDCLFDDILGVVESTSSNWLPADTRDRFCEYVDGRLILARSRKGTLLLTFRSWDPYLVVAVETATEPGDQGHAFNLHSVYPAARKVFDALQGSGYTTRCRSCSWTSRNRVMGE